MKSLGYIIIITVLVSGLYLTGCSDSGNKTDSTGKNTEEQTAGGEVITISVPTVQCNMCKKNITNAVKEVEGVNEVDVNMTEKTVKVSYDKSKTDVSKVEASITAAGYDANDKKSEVNAYEKLDDCCKKPEDQKEKGMHNM